MINRLMGLTLSIILFLPYSAGVHSAEPKADQSLTGTNSEEHVIDHNVADTNSEQHSVDHDKDSTISEELLIDHDVDSSGSEEQVIEQNVSDASSEQHNVDHNVNDTASNEHVIDQQNKTFSHSSITVGVGDTVRFVNSDSYFHNVYSLSETAQFDLGSYPKGESRTITVDKVGEIVAQCAIHPRMRIAITVEDK